MEESPTAGVTDYLDCGYQPRLYNHECHLGLVGVEHWGQITESSSFFFCLVNCLLVWTLQSFTGRHGYCCT